MRRSKIIEEFFDFDGCDFIGNYLVQHYDVVLKKQIGDIPVIVPV